MRKKQSHFSHSSAFSLFELILVIFILAVLGYQALPRFWASESVCLYKLRNKLLKSNDALTLLYAKHVVSVQRVDVSLILEDLTDRQDPHCFFEYRQDRLLAHIGRQTLGFVIDPKDFSSKPKIYCSLSNELCRSFWGKKLKK